MKSLLAFITAFLISFFPSLKPAALPPPTTQNTTGLSLSIPKGFSISTFATDLGQPRILAFDSQNKLVVSIPEKGQLVTLPEKQIIVSNLNRPHGMVFTGKKLFVAETNKVSVLDYDPNTRIAINPKKLVDLPSGGGHWTRSLTTLNNQLLISVGSSCNVCNESDWRRAKILSYPLDPSDASGLKVFASGLRNSVFMNFSPTSGLWSTEMGRDWLGNDLPPDEINIIEEGNDYGWPDCYGQNIPDGNKSCANKTPSHIDLPAHSAPLGFAFIPNSWPKEYQNKLLVAFHGSWNRNPPDGYKIVLIDPDTKKISDFVTGWLQPDGTALGRPVDLLFDSQGNLFVSDDKRGVVYQISPPAPEP